MNHTKRKVSISIGHLQFLYGDHKALEIAAEIGADAVDFDLSDTTRDYRNADSIYSKSDEEIERLIKASSALPGLFDPIKINDKFYRDGCIKDDVPIDPLYKEGCNEIIIIYLGEDERVDLSKYPGVKFYEISPRVNLGGMLDGNLDFSGSGANKRILQGYLDTMAYFDKLAYEEGVPLNKLDIIGEIK